MAAGTGYGSSAWKGGPFIERRSLCRWQNAASVCQISDLDLGEWREELEGGEDEELSQSVVGGRVGII